MHRSSLGCYNNAVSCSPIRSVKVHVSTPYENRSQKLERKDGSNSKTAQQIEHARRSVTAQCIGL